MEIKKYQIGDVEISQISEIDAGEIIQGGLKDATPGAIKKIKWLSPDFADENGKLKATVNCFLIKSNGKNILIDTCNGNNKKRTDLPVWGNLKTDFLDNLPEIDIVCCTHLHFDHVGWNTKLVDGGWQPTFPNAKYLFVKEEYESWKTKPQEEIADDRAGFIDSVEPVVKAGLAKFIPKNYQIDENITLFPTPGHTPHHVSVIVKSKGQTAIISGDVLHHPCQINHPEWAAVADRYPELAIKTRKEFIKKVRNENALLLGSHFTKEIRIVQE